MYSLLILTSSLALSQAQINYQPILDNYNQIIPPTTSLKGDGTGAVSVPLDEVSLLSTY